MLYFPQPYPDELVSSLFIRACLHLGLPPKRLQSELYGAGRSPHVFLLPADVTVLAEAAGIDAEELLWSHTLFPYAVAYSSPADVNRHEDEYLAGGRSKGTGAFLRSIGRAVPCRRACPRCIEDDHRVYGETWWKRAHHLPGMSTCLWHGARLREFGALPTDRPVTAETALTPAMARRGRPVAPVPYADAEFTLLSQQALLKEDGYAESWAAVYRDAALKSGYRTKSGDVASAHLAQELRHRFGAEWLNRIGCPVGSTDGTNWVGLLARDGWRDPVPTLKHLLLGALLARGDPPATTWAPAAPGPKPKASHMGTGPR